MDILTLESHAKDLLIYLNELYLGKSLCDVHIRSKDGIYFTAHKIVLASSSLHVYQMVMSNPSMAQLSLDVPSHVLQTLIEFIYTGKLLVPRHLWLEIQNAATFLQMYNVLDLMKRFVMGEVQPSHLEQSNLDLSLPNAILDPSRAPSQLDVPQANSHLDPSRAPSQLDVTHSNSHLDSPQATPQLDVTQASSHLDPTHMNTSLDLTCASTNLGPTHTNTNPEPTALGTDQETTHIITNHDQTGVNTNQEDQQKQVKSVADASTMTAPSFMTDLFEGNEACDFSKNLIIKKEPEKTTEILTYDADSGPLARLRPQVRPNFSNMHQEDPFFTMKKPKRKSTPSKGKNTKTATTIKKRKKRKHKKRVNRFGQEMRYKCLYCYQKFKLLYKRHRHMCHSHSDKYFTWLYSTFTLHKNLRLKQASNFYSHKNGSRKVHKCSLCPKKFTKYSLFIFHYGRKHMSPWKQTWFNYVSHRSQRLPKRSKLKRDFECLKCPKAFISESNLAIHYERYHYDPNDLYQKELLTRLKERRADISCKLCGKSYHFQSSLSRHMILHNDDKPHQCATCGKIFSLKAGLKEHAIVHGENKTCICAVCGKCYKHRQSLRRHMSEHDPDKKVFTCSFCGKVYDRNDKLLTHLRTHESLHDLLAPPVNYF